MKTKLIVTIALTALITSLVTYAMLQSGESTATGLANGSARRTLDSPKEQAVKIAGLRTERAVAGESWQVIAATGKVGPNTDQTVRMSPRIAGKVVSVRARLGDTVARGETLATISSVELAQARADYRQAQARAHAARDAYQRQLKLAKLGAFSKRPAEEARGELMTAQGELAQAQAELAQGKAELARAEGERAQCASRLSRARELYKDQIVSKQDLESAEAELKRDLAEVEAAHSRIRQTEAKIEQAQARVGIAGSYHQREQKILANDLLAAKELKAAKAELTAAELQVSAAADTIRVLGAVPGGTGDTIALTSPLSGRVVQREANIGEMVGPEDILFMVINLSDVWVEASLYEKDLAKVRPGQTAQVRVDAFAERVFTGRIGYVGDLLDPESRTAKVRCLVANPDGALKPEMFATITIITSKHGRAVLVPRQCVLDDSGKKILFTPCMECEQDVRAGTNACGSYDKREVKLGPVHDGKVEVLSGIRPGEKVVTTGAYQLLTALASGKLEAGCKDH